MYGKTGYLSSTIAVLSIFMESFLMIKYDCLVSKHSYKEDSIL